MSRPLKLNSVMRDALKEYGLDKKARSYAVITDWPQIVGEKVAAVTEPQKIERGVLSVKVTNSVWRYELTLRKQDILKKIQRAHGMHEVTEIQWR